MKVTVYGVAIATVAQAVAEKLTPAKSSPALHAKDISQRPHNDLEARSYDFCGSTTYYCLDSTCCGITWFHCMPDGADCCAGYLASGEGLWCEEGTTCTVVGGYVMCKDTNGDTFSAGSSAIETPTSSAGGPSQSGSSGSSFSGSKKKKKSKAWIAPAVILPLLGVAAIAGVIFFLCVLKKKKSTNASANGAVMATQQGGTPGQPAIATTPAPFMAPVPQQQVRAAPGPDLKTPAYTYQHEVPTPVASPPPQWSPPIAISPIPTAVSPVPMAASPVPIPPPQTMNELSGMNTADPISPMGTGNAPHAPQPVYGNTMELPTTHGAPAPRGGTHEMGG